MADILVKQGQPIPLVAVMSNGATNKIIEANLYDQATGALLTTTPITLTHIAQGYYQDNSFLMPVLDRIVAIFDIFDLTDFAAKFTSALIKIDNDTGIVDSDYSQYSVGHDDALTLWITNFNAVLTKLDNDTGVADIDYSDLALSNSATVQQLVTNFNLLLAKLDDDSSVVDTDYATLSASFHVASSDTESTGTELYTLDTGTISEGDGGGGGAVTFYIGTYADFLFMSDLLITPDMISIFYIQEDQPASVRTTYQEPFLNLKDTDLTVVPNGEAPVHFHFPDKISSSLEVSSFINNAVQASGYSGVSGVVASASGGFVIIETNNTGQLATLDVTVANTQLGIGLQSVTGQEQRKVTLLDVNVEVKSVGDEQIVSFYVDGNIFTPGELYFVEFDNGVKKSLQKFTVLRKKNTATVNFVAKVP